VNIFDARRKTRVSIAEMIAQCTDFEVKRGDLLPEMICPPCLEDAKNAFSIRQTCERSHQFYCQVRDNGIEEALCTLLDEEDWDSSEYEEKWKHSPSDDDLHDDDEIDRKAVLIAQRPSKHSYVF